MKYSTCTWHQEHMNMAFNSINSCSPATELENFKVTWFPPATTVEETVVVQWLWKLDCKIIIYNIIIIIIIITTTTLTTTTTTIKTFIGWTHLIHVIISWVTNNYYSFILVWNFVINTIKYNSDVKLENCHGNIPYMSVPRWWKRFKMLWMKHSWH